MHKVKKRVDNRPALSQNLIGGFLKCQICNEKKSWKGGSFTRHLRDLHNLTAPAYYLQVYGDSWKWCLCGCAEETAWEPREGYYKGYVSGHNYRGKTKQTDISVAIRAEKMILNKNWSNSTFKKGQVPWNKCSTDTEYLEKLFKKTKIALRTSGIKRGVYTSTKTGNAFYYDSGWELERMKIYDSDTSICSWSRCKDLIPYTDNKGQQRHYNPDFVVDYGKGCIVVEEIKGGRFGESIYSKLKAAADYYSHRHIEYIVVSKRQAAFIRVPIEFFQRKKEL